MDSIVLNRHGRYSHLTIAGASRRSFTFHFDTFGRCTAFLIEGPTYKLLHRLADVSTQPPPSMRDRAEEHIHGSTEFKQKLERALHLAVGD